MKVGKYKSEYDPWGSLYFPEDKKGETMIQTIEFTPGLTVGGMEAPIRK